MGLMIQKIPPSSSDHCSDRRPFKKKYMVEYRVSKFVSELFFMTLTKFPKIYVEVQPNVLNKRFSIATIRTFAWNLLETRS